MPQSFCQDTFAWQNHLPGKPSFRPPSIFPTCSRRQTRYNSARVVIDLIPDASHAMNVKTTNHRSGSDLTREALLNALRALSDELGDRGVTGEICLFGGTVMVLAFSARVATKDIDALFKPA